MNQPRLHRCVGAIVIRQRHVLLGKRAAPRDFFPTVWDVFGGHIEPGEQPEHTLVRELGEELGIRPTRWRALGTYTDQVAAGPGMTTQSLVLTLFCVTAWSGTPANLQPHEHEHIGWFTLDQVAELALAHSAYPQLFAACLADSGRLQ